MLVGTVGGARDGYDETQAVMTFAGRAPIQDRVAAADGFTPFPDSDERLGAPRRARPRIVFFVHDDSGLGHVRMTLALAEELSRVQPDAVMLVITGARHFGRFPLPANLDVLQLPWAHLRLPPSAPDLEPIAAELRLRAIQGALAGFAPDLVIVDFMPAGSRGELAPALRWLRVTRPNVSIVLSLRDVIDRPTTGLRWWWGWQGRQLLEEVYDCILVHGSQAVHDSIDIYAFPDAIARKVTFCGYMQPQPSARTADAVRHELGLAGETPPLVVVTAGGGVDGGALMEAYLLALRDGGVPEVASLLVTGPTLPPERLARYADLAATLPRVTVLPFTTDLMSYLNAADLIISLGGYNAACEVVSLGKRAIIVPRRPGDHEQLIRAERFAELGLWRMLDPRRLTPQLLARAMRLALAGPPPSATLDFGGLERAGAILTALLARDTAPR
jgi:predicted glycosyltransferase